MKRMTVSDINGGKKLFETEYGYADSKHKVNLSTREVPESLLKAVSKGCSIETLEKLAADFPICKYQTQITVHGLFPQLTTNSVGGFVNLVRNKNKSVGIKYSAIDCLKRHRLADMVRPCGWWYCESSSNNYFYKCATFPETDKTAIVAKIEEYKSDMGKIDTGLFYGGSKVVTSTLWGMVTVALVVTISAVYERNLVKLAENMSGMTEAEIKAKQADVEAERKARDEEIRKRTEAFMAERKARAEQIAAEQEEYIKSNPCPVQWEMVTTIPKAGDRFVRCVHTGDEATGNFKWKFFVVEKRYGHTKFYPCDQNFKRIEGETGIKVSDKEKQYRMVRTVAEVAPKAEGATVKAVQSVSGVVGATITENAEKNGIELRFTAKPSKAVLEGLKANGWRWSRFNQCWYNRATESNRNYASNLAAV